MKRFFKLSWKGIPIGIIASVLIGTAALAAILIPAVTLTITQEITAPIDYGSITVNPITLDDIMVNEGFSSGPKDVVIVEVTSDGVGKYLHIRLNEASVACYDNFSICLDSGMGGTPAGGTAIELVVTKTNLEATSAPITTAGTYIFNAGICGTAGPDAATATVDVDITLEDS